MVLKALLNGILGLVYPRQCMGCEARIDALPPACLCPQCLTKITHIGPEQCPRCGGRMGPFAGGVAACHFCAQPAGRRPLVFHRAVAVYNYEDTTREIVHDFKFRGNLAPAEWMGREVAAKVAGAPWLARVDLVVPVPLHWTRRLRRRFNQSELLARWVARVHGLPLSTRLLRRIRKTVPQSTLTPRQRTENVRGAFRAKRSRRVEGRTLLLVDDVMSTCSTAAECARALKHAGAKQVYVAVFAR